MRKLGSIFLPKQSPLTQISSQDNCEMATIILETSRMGKYMRNNTTGKWVEVTKSIGFICVSSDSTPVKQTKDACEALCFLLDLPYDANNCVEET